MSGPVINVTVTEVVSEVISVLVTDASVQPIFVTITDGAPSGESIFVSVTDVVDEPINVNVFDDGGTGDITAAQALLDKHVNDPNPHSAYDDIPSLTLLFENGLL